jgi:phospholipid/cholesterol/gamma-HCH transport system substrate-binding protein
VNLTKEFKVGLFALIGGIILYLGFNYLKGADLFSSTRRYFVIYDRIDGLTVSNAVMLNGMNVGRVEKIRMLTERNNQLLVTLEINENVALGDSSKAVLTDSDLLGGKTIDIEVGKSSNRLSAEDTLIAGKVQGITDILQQKAVPVLDNLDSTAVALYQIMREFEGTATILKSTLQNFEQSSSTVNTMMRENRSSVKQITANFSKLSSSLVETEKSLKPIIGKMDRFADTLNQMQLAKAVDNANKSMQELNAMMTKINRGEGSLGKLVNNDSLYNNLNSTSHSLDLLLKDVKENPRRYINVSVFGRRDKD